MNNPAPTPLAARTGMRIATFRLAEEWFGIDVLRVQEVLLALPCCEVPLSAPHILGLINIRGQILTAISLRRRLGFTGEYPPGALDVILKHRDHPVCVMVDEIGDVVETEDVAQPERLSAMQPEIRPFIQGVCRFEDRLVVLLDVDKLIAP